MLRKDTIGDWTVQRLAQFVQSLPNVQARKDKSDAPGGSVAGAIPTPASANVDDGIFWDGFNWVAGKVNDARVAAGAAIAYTKLTLTNSIVNADIKTTAAIAYSKLALAAAIKASDMNSQSATLGQPLVADGAGAATYGADVTATSEHWANFTTGGNNLPAMPNASSSEVLMMWIVPPDYKEGTDVTVYWRMANTVGSNVMKIDRYVIRYRDATAANVLESAANSNVTLADTNAHDRTFTIANAGINRGDSILVDWNRLGADGADTNTGDGQVQGVWCTYTKQL